MNTNKPIITATLSKNKIDEKEVFFFFGKQWAPGHNFYKLRLYHYQHLCAR